jgi:hypothetical protein
MSSTPRIIAVTTSAALLAGAGAAGAVVAVDIVTSTTPAVAEGPQDQAPGLAEPKDDSTTVYREPGSAASRPLQPAAPDTTYQSGKGAAGKNSTSHSS